MDTLDVASTALLAHSCRVDTDIDVLPTALVLSHSALIGAFSAVDFHCTDFYTTFHCQGTTPVSEDRGGEQEGKEGFTF